MRLVFYFGWLLLVVAFVSTAAEPFLVQLGRGGLMTSSYDLWYALSPASLVITEIRIDRLWPALWDPVLVTLLQVPAWLLAGGPGLVAVWTCRPNKVMSPEVQEEYERQRESLFIIDELSDQALLDENYDPREDDRAPSHLMFDLHKDEDDDIRESVYPGDTPAGYPDDDYADEYLNDLKREQQAIEELRDHMANPLEVDSVRIIDGLAFSTRTPTLPDDAEVGEYHPQRDPKTPDQE